VRSVSYEREKVAHAGSLVLVTSPRSPSRREAREVMIDALVIEIDQRVDQRGAGVRNRVKTSTIGRARMAASAA